jgi:hypothetical protein
MNVIKIVLIIISVFFAADCMAQDTVLRRNRLSDSVLEKFYVLKSNPEVRNGPYQAIFRRDTYIAIGNYTNNQKTGIWQFFNKHGRLIEKYNYNSKAFTFEAPLVPSDDLSYLFDDTLRTDDTLTRPLKAGGNYYGMIPYLSLFRLPFDTFNMNTNSFLAFIELLVSPLGRLADYKVYVRSDMYQYSQDFNFDVNLFSEEDRTFAPATLNGRPIMSRIVIKCYLNYYGGLDFY